MNRMTMPLPVYIETTETTETMYYNSKDLQKYDPLFYWGCKSKPRNIIKKKQICESEYLFANLKMGKWNISTAKCKKSQLLITKNWVDINMKSMNEKYNEEFAIANTRVDDDIQHLNIEKLELLEKIKTLEDEIDALKEQHNNEVEIERCEFQFLKLQLENNLQFSKLKEEKYLLQIQMLQNK